MSEQNEVVLHPETRLYELLRHDDTAYKPKTKKKTYWEKYPELKLLRKLGRRRIISFMFFAYLFLFASAEFTDILQFGYSILIAQFIISIFIIFSGYCFDYGVKNCRLALLIPFMSIVMGALSCFVCLFALIMMTVLNIPPFHYFLLGFHIYIFVVTAAVTFILAKGTDLLWQGFFCLVDLSADEELLEKLRTNAFMEEEPEHEKFKRKKSSGLRYSFTERRRN